MALLNQQDVRIQVLVNKDTEIGRFQDAIYYTPVEFNSLDQKELDNLKDKRASDWVQFVKDQSQIDTTPTKEQLEAAKVDLELQVVELTAKIAEK